MSAEFAIENNDFAFEGAPREVRFAVSEALYPKDAIYGAAYLFLDRCYVYLTRPADGRVGVRLRARDEASAEAMEELAGEFANELLNQVLRARVGEATSRVRELYMQRAFFPATPTHTSIDSLLAELDAEELADDPLEISVPWED